MIRAVYRDGKIQPLDELPQDWQDGEPLEIRPLGHPLQTGDPLTDTDDWVNERGAFANYSGPMPPHVHQELERRLAEFHALGPMEFETGEREAMEDLWKEMDELGRK